MGDNKEMILTNFLGSIKLELSEVVLGPYFIGIGWGWGTGKSSLRFDWGWILML